MSAKSMHRGALAVLLLVVALVVGACGGGSDGGGNAVTGQETTASGGIEDGGKLTFGATIGVEQLDPNTINSAVQQQLLTLLWNGLTRWGPGMEVVPDLATDWRSSDGNRTWTFRLRDGVRFHDGRPFTADDVVANVERVLDPRVPAQVRVKIDMIRRAVAVDPTTVRFDLSEPNAELPAGLIEVKMTDVARIGQINRTANGTGPYRLAKFVPGQTVNLVRDDAYWGEKGHFDAVDVVRYADQTAAEGAFRGGDLDVLWSVPPTSVDGLASAGSGQVLESREPSGVMVWELDTSSPPFDDPRAREALALAADRRTMFDAAYGGRGTVNTVDTVINPTTRYAARDLTSHDYDLDRAKQLFEQAGVREGTKLTYWTVAGSFPEWTTIGEILQQDLQKIGIDLEIKKSELSAWSSKFYPKPKRFPGLVVANYLSFPPLPIMYPLQWFGADGDCECNWKPPASYGAALRTAETSTDEAARTEAMAQMQREQNRGIPVVTIANSALLSVATGRLRGAWVQSDGGVHLEDAGFAAGAEG